MEYTRVLILTTILLYMLKRHVYLNIHCLLSETLASRNVQRGVHLIWKLCISLSHLYFLQCE